MYDPLCLCCMDEWNTHGWLILNKHCECFSNGRDSSTFLSNGKINTANNISDETVCFNNHTNVICTVYLLRIVFNILLSNRLSKGHYIPTLISLLEPVEIHAAVLIISKPCAIQGEKCVNTEG